MAERSADGQKFAIGPLNQAGQGNAWANAASNHLCLESFAFANDGLIPSLLRRTQVKDKAHKSVPHYRITPPHMRRLRITSLLRGVSHVLNESNSPIFGDPRSNSFCDEIGQFHRREIRVGLVFHGSDIRDPRKSIELNEFSYFKDAPTDWVEKFSGAVAKNFAQTSELGIPVFVSTLDLLEHMPDASWLPLSIDVDYWNAETLDELFTHRLPRVMHRPSRSNPPIKGTQYIDPVLRQLDAAGLITYVTSETTAHSMMRDLLSRCDIVVDQIQTGAYGVAAIEAMAAGRIVVGNVSASAEAFLGGPVPIVNATPRDFEQVMLELISDPSRMRDLANRGPAFARKWHDGRSSASALQTFLSAD